MSDHTDDEYEFTEFTEDELRSIDSTAEVALDIIWPPSSSDPQLVTRLSKSNCCQLQGLQMGNSMPHNGSIEHEGDPPRSRKSSGFSTFDLTEEELQLIDHTVARLVSGVDSSSGHEPPTLSTYSQLPYVEITIESPVPSTLVASPAPTLGRSPSPSLPEMASLYSRFRASRNSLSVSDLVGPVWCEVQFDYGLRGKRYLPPSLRPEVLETRSGKKIQVQQEVAIKNHRILKKGTAVHKKLEREIRPIEVEITPNTREDTWGLKLLNMISNLRILIDEGCCREMPVMGFVHGHFVTGVIDEILRASNTSRPTVSRGTPSQEPSSSFFSGSKDSEWAGGNIHILDNKTRGTNSPPRARDALQSRLQLMLYKRLLDTLLVPAGIGSSQEGTANRQGLSFHDIWVHHSLDPSASFSPSFLQESAALVSSNGLGPEAENAVCLEDLENVWNTIVSELVRAVGPGEHDGVVSNILKLVYRRRGMSKKRLAYAGESTQEPSKASSPETQYNEQKYNKNLRGRAESEDVELQRAIHESLRHSGRTVDSTLQDETSEVMGRQRQDESEGLMQETGGPVRVPGGWISPEDDIQRAIDESKKSYHKQMGREVLPPSPPPLALDSKRKQEDHEGVIGVVEFEHDGVLLDTHLSSVLDFWHDRRAPRGVDLEDTGRCRYCEFSEGCEWLEAKAKEITQGLPKRK
ncbi:exonuclease V a 5' deoxyribonuclease-domain-containing protein [Rhizoctonia solani]|nr:exonuclease V a 5' deoxyribonuclease-domain-containing protein [Rhizoctonia solani]